MESDYTISTAGESDERAKQVLSFKGKEDKSDILELNIRLPNLPEKPDSIKYFANKKYDWIITIEASPANLFHKDSIKKYINKDWRKQLMYPTVYCLPEKSNNWTYLFAANNEDETFKKIALTWKLYDPIEDPPTIYNEKTLSEINKAVKKKIKEIKADKIEYNYSIQEASSVSNGLSDFVTENNQWAIIVLKADKKFEGKEIWDVMMSLGLRWGDMDLFHWSNTDFEVGDDQFLSVWTSTEPGYFFPEEIAAGNVKTEDLIFGFSIPRSIAPQKVFKVMCEVTEYAQKRLGGQILDGNGNKLNKKMELDRIDLILKNLGKESINSGIGDALYLFQ
ncbi:cell division protein ZipA C-terminal FtsZ-binding domain-containing protein [Spongiimicrobium salis]|uniref:cell division protein ZipA C-terminal FtsZ-binding domain-containing protein n=1 Tax=Spongiimicrobium salis TaxID=1667022 RepID=UPI00374CDA24